MILQRRKIWRKITYKDKTFNLILMPVFQTIVENQYILKSVSGSDAESISAFAPKNANNRTVKICEGNYSSKSC